jgi:hypothetical protein
MIYVNGRHFNLETFDLRQDLQPWIELEIALNSSAKAAATAAAATGTGGGASTAPKSQGVADNTAQRATGKPAAAGGNAATKSN